MNSKSKEVYTFDAFNATDENVFVENLRLFRDTQMDFSVINTADLCIMFSRSVEILENKIRTSQSEISLSILMSINEMLKKCYRLNETNLEPMFKVILSMNSPKFHEYSAPEMELECIQFLQIIFNQNNTDFMTLFEKLGGTEMIALFLKSDNRKVQMNSWRLLKRILKIDGSSFIVNSKHFLETIIDTITQDSFLQVKIIVAYIFLNVLDRNNLQQILFLKKDLNVIQILLNQIHFEHHEMLRHSKSFADKCSLITKYLWCLMQLTASNTDYQYLRDIGGIPIILSLFHVPNDILVNATSHGDHQMTDMADKYSQMMEAASTIVSTLCRNESNNLEVAQKSGIYLLARLLIILPNINNQSLVYLQKCLFRALRFLFSLERNRKRFKNIFPALLYESFVDIGHFCSNLDRYEEIVSIFKNLTETDKITMKDVIECLNQKDEIRCIRDYVIMELLGSGAFGSVYKARRSKSLHESFCAIKEVNLTECQLGSTSQERSDSIRQIVCELDIIKNQLRHPNVVRYYRTFHDAQNLYVVMAFIEGISLGEQISCMKEKKELYQEERIWKMTIQLMLALRYLHKEKGIIHRDLTPNNIMVGDGDHTTITDFGLAKQRLLESRGRESRSILGTLTYVCPEVIQHQPYAEKADIWSLGCIIYQMCTLTQPFNAESELTLADKICKGRYVPLKEFQSQLYDHNINYCEEFGDLVEHCLITDPNIRSGVLDLARLVSDKIFMYLDQSHQRKIELENSFNKERKQRKMLESQIKELNSRERVFRMDALTVDNSSPDLSPAVRSENDQASDDFNVDGTSAEKSPCIEFNPFARSISSEFSSVRSSGASDTPLSFGNSTNNQISTPKLCSFSSVDNSQSSNKAEHPRRRIKSRPHLKNENTACLKHCSSSSLMSISQKSLRHIPEDPITKLLTWLHKLYFLCNTQFSESQCDTFSDSDLVQSKRYFKTLFNHVLTLQPNQMKKEINCLQSGDESAVLATISNGCHCERFIDISTEEFNFHMEDLLSKLDYYQ